MWSAASVFLVLSVACGIWTHLGIATVLAPPKLSNGGSSLPESDRSIRHQKIRKPFALQLVSFGIGVILMGAYQVLRVWKT